VSDQKGTWLQRLVGADGSAAAQALEEQLNKAKEEAQQLSQELQHEREVSAVRQARLEQAEAQARGANEDFEARLVAVRQASQEKLEAAEDLERKHKQVVSELLSARTQNKRLAEEKEKLGTQKRDEGSKQSQALSAALAQVSAQEADLQAAKSQLTELKTKLIAESSEAQKAREQARERERMSDVNAKELAEARRKLQALETRASTIEHELAQARQAEQSAETSADQLRTEIATAKARRDQAQTMASDLWRALGRVVGEGAALALSLGVDADGVPKAGNLAEASVALKRAFESQALCQSLKTEAVPGGVQVELRAADLSGNAVAAPWLMASATRFLEKASGLELAIDTSSVDRDTLKFRLSESVRSRTAS
jgi:hypothetical protein